MCNPISWFFIPQRLKISHIFYFEVNCTLDACTVGCPAAFCFIQTTYTTFEPIVFERFLQYDNREKRSVLALCYSDTAFLQCDTGVEPLGSQGTENVNSLIFYEYYTVRV